MKHATMIFLIIAGVLAAAYCCDECGEECRKACGTKQFKTCCFNYLRKRSMPDLRLELSLANSQARQRQALAQFGPFGLRFGPPRPRQGEPEPEGGPPSELEPGRLQLIYDA